MKVQCLGPGDEGALGLGLRDLGFRCLMGL